MSKSRFERELTATKLALTVGGPEDRSKFLTYWFQLPVVKAIAADPFRRGAFARDVGLTPRELGQWNAFCATL